MSNNEVATGVVHEVPSDLRETLVAEGALLALWNDLTPLGRNEWICWIEAAKMPQTRRKRIERAREEIKSGKRRPCCWPGCPHRAKNK